MYSHLLASHNILRWAVFLLGLWAVADRWRAVLRAKDITTPLSSTLFIGFLDVQLLIGVLLYIYSPLRSIAFANPGSVLADETGYLIFIHSILMIVAIIGAHAANVISKCNFDSALKRQVTALLLTISFLILGFSIPWWRPLIRL